MTNMETHHSAQEMGHGVALAYVWIFILVQYTVDPASQRQWVIWEWIF